VVVLFFVYRDCRGAKDRSSTQSVQGKTSIKGTSFLLPPHTLVYIELKGGQCPC
jgi:hypothetical protein